MLQRALRVLFVIGLFVGLALVTFYGLARCDDPSLFSVQSDIVTIVPGTTTGALIEDDAGTVFHWKADDWNILRFPEAHAVGSVWTVSNVTVTAGATTGPFGSSNADAIVDNVTNASASAFIAQNPTGLPSAVRTVSHFVKAGVYRYAFVQGGVGTVSIFDLTGVGAVTLANGSGNAITSVGNGWYRIVQFDSTARTTTNGLVGFTSNPASINCARTVGTVGGYVWGSQAVLGPVPLPYQPNPGSTIGGAGDTFVMNGTVPLATTSPLFPRGAGVGRSITGPLDLTHAFTQATIPILSADGIVCFAFRAPFGTPTYGVASKWTSGSAGWRFQVNAGTTAFVQFDNATPVQITFPNAPVPGMRNVACFGAAGTSGFVKMNAAASATLTKPAGWTPSANSLSIGHIAGVADAPDLYVDEVWATTTPWTEPGVAAIEASAMSGGGTAALFADDAGTIFHAIGNAYDGATWGTPFGNLTSVGVPGQLTSWVPGQSSNLPMLDRTGYGPFSDANFLSLGTGNDSLDFAGDFTAVIVFTGEATGVGGNKFQFSDGTPSTDGWSVDCTSAACNLFYATDGGLATVAPSALSPNVVCTGRNGGSIYLKQNLSAIASKAAPAAVPATAKIAKLGRGEAGGSPDDQPIFEIWASTTPITDALCTKIAQHVLQQVDAFGLPFSDAHTGPLSYLVPGSAQPTLFYAPSLVASGSPDGIVAADATTNLALQSETLTAAPWVATGTVVTADQAIFVDGQTTMELLNSTGQPVTSFVQQPVTVTSSTGPWTASTFFRGAVSAIGSVGMTVGAGAATGCTCSITTTDGSTPPACTTGTSTTNGFAYATLVTTNPVRLSVTCSSTVATTTVSPFVEAGQWNTSVGQAFFGGAQFEVHAHPTSYLPTLAASASRTRSQLIYPQNPFGAYQGGYCIDAVMTPSWGRSWSSDDSRIIHIGTNAAANQTFTQATGAGNLVFTVVDGAGGTKTVTFAHSFTPGSAHRVTGCADQAGGMTLYADGVAVGATAGAGTGIITMSSALATQLLGINGSANGEGDSSIRNVKFCRGSAAQCLAAP